MSDWNCTAHIGAKKIEVCSECEASRQARIAEMLSFLDAALARQHDTCDHSDIGKPGCIICDTVRLDRIRKGGSR